MSQMVLWYWKPVNRISRHTLLDLVKSSSTVTIMVYFIKSSGTRERKSCYLEMRRYLTYEQSKTQAWNMTRNMCPFWSLVKMTAFDTYSCLEAKTMWHLLQMGFKVMCHRYWLWDLCQDATRFCWNSSILPIDPSFWNLWFHERMKVSNRILRCLMARKHY